MKKHSNVKLNKAAARRMILVFEKCKTDGLKFNLSFQSFLNLLSANRCQFSGEKIYGERNIKICMINPKLGYVKGNVMATNMQSYNFIKNRVHAVMCSKCPQAKKSMKRIISSF